LAHRLHHVDRGCRLNVHTMCRSTKVDKARRRFDARDPLSSTIPAASFLGAR